MSKRRIRSSHYYFTVVDTIGEQTECLKAFAECIGAIKFVRHISIRMCAPGNYEGYLNLHSAMYIQGVFDQVVDLFVTKKLKVKSFTKTTIKDMEHFLGNFLENNVSSCQYGAPPPFTRRQTYEYLRNWPSSSLSSSSSPVPGTSTAAKNRGANAQDYNYLSFNMWISIFNRRYGQLLIIIFIIIIKYHLYYPLLLLLLL